jgi:hypothetical protein
MVEALTTFLSSGVGVQKSRLDGQQFRKKPSPSALAGPPLTGANAVPLRHGHQVQISNPTFNFSRHDHKSAFTHPNLELKLLSMLNEHFLRYSKGQLRPLLTNRGFWASSPPRLWQILW